jgi:membrane-bound lytic murein transglycosylase D
MRPMATTLPLILASMICLPAPGLAAVPGLPAAAVPLALQAAEASRAGNDALPPAAVPAPRLVLSTAAQARLGSEQDEQAEADGEASDSPEIQAEIRAESAEMEDLRRAEEASHVRDAPGTPGLPGSATEGLGLDATPHERGQGGRIELLPELDHDLATLQAEYDIPIDVNPAVVAYVRFFQAPLVRPHFVKWLGRSHRYLERYREILDEEGLPRDTVYLAMIESGFGNFAYSRAKASGPWQFIAGTGKRFGLDQDFWVDERRDPERSARAAARFLKQLHEQTGDWRLAWAGYNAGVGRIFSARKKGYTDFWSMAAAPGKKVLRPETKGYVPKLMAAAIVAKHPEAFGFREEEIERQSWTDYTEVEIPSATLLSVVARAAKVEEKDLIDLNPELRRSCTPPRTYALKLPVDAGPVFAEAWPGVQATVKTTFAGHVLRRGDTISRVAAQYGVPVEGILDLNHLHGKKLKVGTEILIPRPVAGGKVAAPSPVAAQAAQDEPRRPAEPKASGRKVVAMADTREAARAEKTTLRVRSGDTLWSISQRYGVELSDLCRWNGIKSPDRYKLQSGKRLVVYADRG